MIAASAEAIGTGQGWKQIGELLLAFALSSVVGLERELRGKSAGLRTQAIVGTASALILLVSKYGFSDVLLDGRVVLDPSRVAAQIVSGIGFLGAGLIITRRGAIRGLTTAAAVWETAAIGMAAGGGLWLLAVVVTVVHFVIVLGYSYLGRWLPGRRLTESTFTITYHDGQGVLRDILAACTRHAWSVASLVVEHLEADPVTDLVHTGQAERRLVSVTVALTGVGASEAPTRLADLAGVMRIERQRDEGD